MWINLVIGKAYVLQMCICLIYYIPLIRQGQCDEMMTVQPSEDITFSRCKLVQEYAQKG